MNTAKFSNGASICINDSTAFLVAYEHRIKRNVTVEATAPLLKMLEMKAENTKQTCPHINMKKNKTPKSFIATYCKSTITPAIIIHAI
tara:strand:+ start:334 stop:597 length:264 start_codon:yes stop_codon:yes gene_type:complete